mmetsp:Transcript_137689/g.439878  ORF Transcript_137689/g.439878 Transcript_137689/m.439878 type:complete len:304 (-) Transcript_137689:631-1542(-)
MPSGSPARPQHSCGGSGHRLAASQKCQRRQQPVEPNRTPLQARETRGQHASRPQHPAPRPIPWSGPPSSPRAERPPEAPTPSQQRSAGRPPRPAPACRRRPRRRRGGRRRGRRRAPARTSRRSPVPRSRARRTFSAPGPPRPPSTPRAARPGTRTGPRARAWGSGGAHRRHAGARSSPPERATSASPRCPARWRGLCTRPPAAGRRPRPRPRAWPSSLLKKRSTRPTRFGLPPRASACRKSAQICFAGRCIATGPGPPEQGGPLTAARPRAAGSPTDPRHVARRRPRRPRHGGRASPSAEGSC